MDVLLSAIFGELTARSINFLISKISKPTVLDLEDNLHRALLRAQVIADEAMGRHVTSHAMLLQLDMLREAIHQGYYTLDTFRYQSHNDKDANNQALNHYLPLSKINSLKGFCSFNRNTQISEKLETSLDYLNSMIIDVKELVMFLTSHPRMYRQPYSMHLLLGNCMFGRQMEAELVINFLLQTQPYGTEDLEVLPIIGPDDELVMFKEGCAMKHQNQLSNSNKDRRVLFVVELVGDINEDAWNMLYSASKHCVPRGSKIIVTSRSDKIKRLGTTEAVTLNHLSHEAFWYFFKTLTFGSTDPEMHPRLGYLAMEIASVLLRTFLCLNTMTSLLRDNFEARFWSKVLAFLRGLVQQHVSTFGEHPFESVDRNRTARLWRMVAPYEYFTVYRECDCSLEEVPEIRVEEFMYGTRKVYGKFNFLVWKSRLPPYYSYVYSCELQEQKSKAVKRKRSMKN